MIHSFKDLLMYKNKKLVRQAFDELYEKSADEIYKIKKISKENLKILLSKKDLTEQEEKDALTFAVFMSVGRSVLDGPRSKLRDVEDRIVELSKKFLSSRELSVLLHPNFSYVERMTNGKADGVAKENHNRLMKEKAAVLNKLKNKKDYLKIKLLLDELHKILLMSAEDEANEKEEIRLVERTFEKIKNVDKYL